MSRSKIDGLSGRAASSNASWYRGATAAVWRASEPLTAAGSSGSTGVPLCGAMNDANRKNGASCAA